MRMARRMGLGSHVKPFYLFNLGEVEGYEWNCKTGNISSGGSATASKTNSRLYVKTYKGSGNASGMYARCDVYASGGSATGGVNIDVRKYSKLHAYVADGGRYHYDSAHDPLPWPYIVINEGLEDQCYVDLSPYNGDDIVAGEKIANIRGVAYLKTVTVMAKLTKSSQTAAQFDLAVTKIWVD